MNCMRCGGKGGIRVQYQSGEPFDVALCSCRQGQFLRTVDERLLRIWLGGPGKPPLATEHQIGWLEDFDGETTAPAPVESFVAAGKTGKRAKL